MYLVLKSLTALTYLNLADNRVSDLSPLANLRSLEVLDLFDNEVENVVPLANLENLNELILTDNRIANLGSTGRTDGTADIVAQKESDKRFHTALRIESHGPEIRRCIGARHGKHGPPKHGCLTPRCERRFGVKLDCYRTFP